MAGVKRPEALIEGRKLADSEAAKAGQAVRDARRRRRTSQATLAGSVGISRPRLADIEGGSGAGAPLQTWFSLAKALRMYLRFEFGRDPQQDLRDAGHLDIQELLLRVGKEGGWERAFEAKSGSWASDRSVDVRLLDRKGRRLVVGECWNTFGDIGDAGRSSSQKVRDAQQQAIAIAGEGEPFEVGLVWMVRDTRANRALVSRYPQIFESRFPGSSRAWLEALMHGGPLPSEPGLLWCDLRATRLFVRRRGRPPR